MTKRRDKGAGSVYQRADGRWMATVDVGVVGGKRRRRSVSAATKAECTKKLALLQRQLATGVLPSNITFSRWIDHWLDEVAPTRNLRPATIADYRRLATRELQPLLGAVRLTDLGPDHVRAMRADMAGRGLSPTTIRNAHALGRAICDTAVAEQRKAVNPFRIVKAPNRSGEHYAILPADAAVAVLASAQGSQEAVRLACALLLGLRQGEALGLRWEHVHEAEGWLEVAGAVRAIKGEGMVLGPTKSARSRRRLPLPHPLPTLFASWRALSGGEGWVFPSPRKPDAPRAASYDWRCWKAALERAGAPSVPLHGARGTTATLLRRAGVSERVIADILGHADAQVTTDNYLRSDEADRLAALTALSGVLAGLPADAAPDPS